MHHIFIEENQIDVSKKLVTIEKVDKDNFDHLVKSLRIKVGELILCSVGKSYIAYDYRCKVRDITRDYIEFDIEEKMTPCELPIKINLYQGLPKSDKYEFIIEKAVELGAYSITAVEMKYSVAKINDKADKKLERYSKIARSAAEQSKRNIVPEVKAALTYDEMIETIKGKNAINILFYENAEGIEMTRKFINGIKDSSKEINVIIGPEGGFSDKEIEKAKASGIEILSLGDRILRTETAAITALSVIMVGVS